MRVLYIFSLLLFTSVVIAEEGTINETKIRQLAEQAWALKNLGKDKQAEDIYLTLLEEPDLPLDIALDYTDLLVGQLRYREAAQLFRYRPMRPPRNDIPLNNRYAFKQAELLVADGKYQKAVNWIEPYKEFKGNRVYSAYFYLMAGELDETNRLLDHLKDNIQYTPHEQKKANWLRMEKDRFWHRRVSAGMRIIDNPAYGQLTPIQAKFKSPIKNNWGRVGLDYYSLDSKYHLNLNLDRVIGFKDKYQLALLYSENQLGFKAGWKKRRGNYQISANAFYRDIETEVTVLMKDFALKDGLEIKGYYKPRNKLILGGSYNYTRYNLSNGDYIGEIHTIHPYLVYIAKDKSPTLQHGVGWLNITGKGDTTYIPNKFDMVYYAISGLHYFGLNKSMINYGLSFGYMQGENFSGFAITPTLKMRYSLARDADLLGGVEYRKDNLTGEAETRANLDLEWRF